MGKIKKILAVFITAAILLTQTQVVIAASDLDVYYSLKPGGTYYFDLSAQGIPGKINPALPDTSLKWVPFTYAGTVRAYSLDATSFENAGASSSAVPSPRTLFVADYNVSTYSTWHEYGQAGLIYGKQYDCRDLSYDLRSLSTGNSYVDGQGSPATNEWDQILTKDMSYIKNLGTFSWGQDTATKMNIFRSKRGNGSPRSYSSSFWLSSDDSNGLRPALMVTKRINAGTYGLKAVTFDMNGNGTLGNKSLTSATVIFNGYNSTVTLPAITEANGFNYTGPGKPGWYYDGTFYEAGAQITGLPTGAVLRAGCKDSEQLNLPIGTYYFDLSTQNIPGTKNTDLPDSNLKWVPFTYAGTVNAYSRTSAGTSTDQTVSVNKRSLFVADYNVTKAVSWDEINNKGLIFGKAFRKSGVSYLLRSLSVGSNLTGNGEGMQGLPLTNEWDQILNKDMNYIKNTSEMYSWGQDTNLLAGLERYLRGYQSSPRGVWTCPAAYTLDTCGFRPVLEIPEPNTLGADGLKTVTFNMGSKGTIGDKKTMTSAKVVYTGKLILPAITEANGFNYTGSGTGTLVWYAGSTFYEPGSTPELAMGTTLTPGYGTAPIITGPTEMSLTEGYSATSTGGYTITGTAPVTVSKTSGDSKITWNDTTKKLYIAAGLTAGSYPVVLTAQNGISPDATLNLTLTVKQDPDIAIVDAAKNAADGAAYQNMTQALATSEKVIAVALKATAVTAVNNSNVTVTINKVNVGYTAPTAGNADNPNGTNGRFNFSVTLSKGSQIQTTGWKYIDITATPFTGITNAQAVAAAKATIVDGSVNVASGAIQADKTAAVQNYVNSIIGDIADAAGVTATVTHDSGNQYNVALSKGSAIDSKSITIMVNEAGPVTVDLVTVKTIPTQTTYTAGDSLDLTGLVVTLLKSNSTTENVAFADFATKGITTTPTNGTELSISDTTVTITYTADGKSVSQNITVAPAPGNNVPTAKTTVPTQSMTMGSNASFTATDIAEDEDSDALTVTGIVTEPDSTYATANLTSGTVTITGLAAGSTSIVVTVSDGNGGTVNVTVPIEITAASEVEISIIQSPVKKILHAITFGLFFDNMIDVSISCMDIVDHYEYQIVADGDSFDENGTWAQDDSFSIVPDFKGMIYARSVYGNGTTSACTVRKLVVDKTKPTIFASYDASSGSIEVSVTDDGAGIEAITYQVGSDAEKAINLEPSATLDITTQHSFTINSLPDGNYNVVINASDNSGNAAATVTLPIVRGGTAPTITTNSLDDGLVGKSYSRSLTAIGDAPITWTRTSGSLPDGLTLSSDGDITGTPETNGTFNFTVKAKNNEGDDTKAFSIEINTATLPGMAPTITTNSLDDGVVGTLYSDTLTATGNSPITWSIESGDLPDGLTFSSDGDITGTPETNATFNFTVKAKNNEGDDTKTLSIEISTATLPGTAPTITTNSLDDGLVGKSYSRSLTATGDAPITWTRTSGSLPDGLTLSSDGDITGIPETNGTFSFTVKAKNNKGDDTKTLSIEINLASSGSKGGSGSSTKSPVPTPEPTREPKTGETKGWTNIDETIKNSKTGDTLVIDMNGTTEVPKSILSDIKGKDITLILDFGTYSWTINGNDVTFATNIDLGVEYGTRNIDADLIDNITGEHSSIQLSLNYNGGFGFTGTLTVKLPPEKSGYFANLFYRNPTTNQLEFQTSGVINADGTAQLKFTHASDYVIVIDNVSRGKEISAGASVTDNSKPITSNGIPYAAAAVILTVGMIIFKQKANI